MDAEFTEICLPRSLLEWVSKTEQINLNHVCTIITKFSPMQCTLANGHYVLRTMLPYGFVPCTIGPTTA